MVMFSFKEQMTFGSVSEIRDSGYDNMISDFW